MAVTITDVAKKAQVSRTTVSRVLSKTPGFTYSDETRNKVMDAAKELNYTPSGVAKLLRLKDSKMIGIVTQARSPQIVHFFQEKCSEKLTELGYYPIFIDLNETFELYGANPLNRFEYLQGILCFHSKQAHSVSAFCKKKKLKAKILSLSYDEKLGDDVLIVATDHFKGGRSAVSFLAGQGHEKIGYLLYLPGERDYKYKGFKDAVAELNMQGISFNSTKIDVEGTPFSAAYKAADTIIEYKDVSAVICQNDESAMGLIAGFVNKGIRVPQDISVIGYDNLPFAEYMNPALTTMAQKVDEVAHHATKLLVSSIEASDVQQDYLPSRMLIEPELIIRNSTCKMEA